MVRALSSVGWCDHKLRAMGCCGAFSWAGAALLFIIPGMGLVKIPRNQDPYRFSFLLNSGSHKIKMRSINFGNQ